MAPRRPLPLACAAFGTAARPTRPAHRVHGKLEIVGHDGHGGLKFDERPFVVMADHAFVDLGRY
jgi:hypothetical protein